MNNSIALLMKVCIVLVFLPAVSVHAQTLMVWGDDASNQNSEAPAGDFKAIADGGTLVAWGWDSFPPPNGALTGLLNAPAGGPFFDVDACVLYSLALHVDGTLYGWGHAAQGTYVLEGWPSTPEDPQIYYIPGDTFKAIAAGNVHALAIRENGSITGWGNATGGALNAPSHVRFKAVAAGWGFSIGLSTDGALWGWGTPVKSPFAEQPWTFESVGWTHHGNTGQYYIPHEHFKSIAAAGFHASAITAGRGPAP